MYYNKKSIYIRIKIIINDYIIKWGTVLIPVITQYKNEIKRKHTMFHTQGKSCIQFRSKEKKS